jgi:RimJ/RimL family protein N-acetyltransferase
MSLIFVTRMGRHACKPVKSVLMSVLVREACPADAARLVHYVERLAAEPGVLIGLSPGEFDLSVEQEKQLLADYAATDNACYLVAESEGEIIGALSLKGGLRRAVRHAATLSMSVERDWRGQGVGSLLLERAIQWARSSGVLTRLELSVFTRNAPAIHLYEKFGFASEGRRRQALFRDGEYHDDLIMALLL